MPKLVAGVPRAWVKALRKDGWHDDPDFNLNPERPTVIMLREVTLAELPDQAALEEAFAALRRRVDATRAIGACGGAPETGAANAVRSERCGR